jgi:hypothetical protein
MANFNGLAAIETPEFMAAMKDKLGTTDAYNHYSVGWAWAMCSPYQWTKQVASHWGGTRNGTIVHWPAGISENGGLRSQFSHVIDVAPTVLEAARLPEPMFVNGVQQAPIEGTNMVYSFDDADAPERHDLQYFEMAATAASTTRGGAPSPGTARRGCHTRSSRRSTRTSGSCTTAAPIGRSRRISPRSCRIGSPRCSACGSSRR